MKLIAIAAASAFVMLGTAAHAQQRPASSPVYGELGYSWLNIEGGGARSNPGAVRGIIGYDLHPNLAVEGMLMGGTNHDSDNGVDSKLNHSYGLFLKPKYDINNVELYGRVGWAHTSVSQGCAAGCANVSGNDVAYGAGVNYNINPRTYVGLDYTRYLDKGGVKADGVTLGLGYRF